jgi:uncharacterized protein DUF1905/bacteriocin resistance YdeI/OmpD-like protein
VIKFKAVLKPDPTGTGTYIELPKTVNASLGLRGRPKVQAVLAGHPYRGSLMPVGDGTYVLGVLKAIQQAAGVKRGDAITVELELDTSPRTVDPPDDLARELARDARAAAAWAGLSFTDKKEMARTLEEAKKPETRARRLAAALERLRS